MGESEILQGKELTDILDSAVTEQLHCVMSHLVRGKWHVANVIFRSITARTLHVEITRKEKIGPINIQIDQPVGISVERGHSKFVFETIVVGFEPSVNENSTGRIVLELPHQIEKIQRRASARAHVPGSMRVNVLFWHRGYTDESSEVPLENYWQGSLVDLSAGGLQICMELIQSEHFRSGQLIGLQFTPMPYEKPILTEAMIRYTGKTKDGAKLKLGVEFRGLEASSEGRKKLRRIVATVGEYEKKSETENNNHAVG